MKTNFGRLLIPIILSTLSFSAFAGNSGGGGNLKPGNPVSVDTVKQYLEKIQVPVELSYKYLSVARFNDQGYFGTEGTPGALDIGKLIFVNKPDIFTKIRSVKPTVVTDGSCKINGVSNDGAAYTNPDRICLDAARIAANPKVGDQDMALVTTALAAHEYSHLVGTSEDQANYLQDMVQEYISERFAEQYPKFLYTLNHRLDFGKQKLQTVLTDIQSQAGWPQVCMDMTLAVDDVFDTVDGAHDNNNGIGFFSRAEFDQVTPDARTASTFDFACKNDAATNSLRSYIWGSNKSIPEAEYLRRRYPNDTGNILTNTPVKRMDYGDSKAVAEGINDLIKMVDQLKSELPTVN